VGTQTAVIADNFGVGKSSSLLRITKMLLKKKMQSVYINKRKYEEI